MTSRPYTDETTLADLANNNSEYKRLIEQYNGKIDVTSLFIEKNEFISQEKARIKNLFIVPIEVKIEGGFKKGHGINYTEYTKQAYEMLSMGQNPQITQFINNIKRQHLQDKPNNYSFNETEFSEAVFKHLSEGVALLKYEKFLNDEKKRIEKESAINEAPSKKPWYKTMAAKIIGTLTVLGLITSLFSDSCNLIDRFSKKEVGKEIAEPKDTNTNKITLLADTTDKTKDSNNIDGVRASKTGVQEKKQNQINSILNDLNKYISSGEAYTDNVRGNEEKIKKWEGDCLAILNSINPETAVEYNKFKKNYNDNPPEKNIIETLVQLLKIERNKLSN